MLARCAALCGSGGGFLVGIDLQKDVATIEAAYNDARGVTAQFNLNLLRRINRELDGNFDLAQFEHLAFYDHGAHIPGGDGLTSCHVDKTRAQQAR